MDQGDPDRIVAETTAESVARTGADPRRDGAAITVTLTEREVRAIIRATTLVADVLRPELMRQSGATPASPLVTAYQTLIAACERHGVDLGLAPRDPTRD
jgi:hypothetical protein